MLEYKIRFPVVYAHHNMNLENSLVHLLNIYNHVTVGLFHLIVICRDVSFIFLNHDLTSVICMITTFVYEPPKSEFTDMHSIIVNK